MDELFRAEFDAMREKEGLTSPASAKQISDSREIEELNKLIDSKQELPYGITRERDGNFYRSVTEQNFSNEEAAQYIMLKQLRNLKVIKGCMIFFTALVAIGIIINIFYSMML